MDTLVSLGYWGLFIGSFLASTIIPMSADVLLVGVLALGGNVWGCLAIATVGNWLGGLTSYWIGWLGRWDWIERWFKVKREKLEQQKGHVDRYGVWLALFTWLPIVVVSPMTTPVAWSMKKYSPIVAPELMSTPVRP